MREYIALVKSYYYLNKVVINKRLSEYRLLLKEVLTRILYYLELF